MIVMRLLERSQVFAQDDSSEFQWIRFGEYHLVNLFEIELFITSNAGFVGLLGLDHDMIVPDSAGTWKSNLFHFFDLSHQYFYAPFKQSRISLEAIPIRL